MKKMVALCLVIGWMMGLCACGGWPLRENGGSIVGTVTTTATQESASSADTTVGSVSATTAAAVEDTTAPEESDPTRTDSPTTAKPTSVDRPSATTLTTTTTVKTTTTATTTTTTTTTAVTTTTTIAGPSLPEGDLIGKKLSVGDQMYDFTVTDSDGNTLTLSQMLQTKEIVVLNFWYINCPFCVKEFPAMNEAYAAYQDRVGMVALNPYDTVTNIGQFRTNNASLTFPMASCPVGWVQTFALRGFPTTMIIDREGVIREMHVGALLKVSDWEALFRPYLAD